MLNNSTKKTPEEILAAIKMRASPLTTMIRPSSKIPRTDRPLATNDIYDPGIGMNSIPDTLVEKILEAVEAGETPDWLILRDNNDDRLAARVWIQLKNNIVHRRALEEAELKLEKLRQQALNKLTKEERDALGI